MSIDRLAQVLWEQSSLLDELEFRLESLELVARSGRHGRVGKACQEVASVQAQIDEMEKKRIEYSTQLAASFGISSSSTLKTIIENSPEEWQESLEETRVDLTGKLVRIAHLTEGLKGVLSQRLEVVNTVLKVVSAPTGVYGADGQAAADRPTLLSEAV